jgi:hypothetical protein
VGVHGLLRDHHNMIIENERDELVVNDEMFDHEGPLAQLDQVQPNLQHSSPCIMKFATETNINIFRMI